MFRVSNALIGILNVLTSILSFCAIGISLYIHFNGGSACHKFVETPLLITGVVLFVLSVIGLLGSWGKLNLFLYVYLTVMFLCILGLIAFTVFAFAVTNSGAGKTFSDRGYKEYRLGDYSNWLKNHAVKGNRWNKIKSCLAEGKVCRKLANRGSNLEEFNKKHLSPIESGCCKPPVECGFEFKNATYWEAPEKGLVTSNSDCKTWSNEENVLCYDCDSCKGGVLANIKREWRNLLFFDIGMIAFVIIVYSTGCCASQNNRKDSRNDGHRGACA